MGLHGPLSNFYNLGMKGFLSPEDRQELLSELRIEDKRKYADRFRVILLLDGGWAYAKIAEALFIDEGTIANYRRRYKEGGIMGLIVDDYSGRRCQLSDNDILKLSNYLQSNLCLSAKEVRAHIQDIYNVYYSLSGVTDLLHRLGFSYKKQRKYLARRRKKIRNFLSSSIID